MSFAPFAPTYTAEPTRPAGGPQPGALALMDWTLNEWDESDAYDDPDPGNLGIYNPRDIYGNQWPNWVGVGSQHARGAALDVRFPTVVGGHPEGWKYARWLVESAAILGVQEVIYGGLRWTNQTKEWRPYNGPSPHNDHVHAALNASGARYLTLARIQSVAPTPTQEDPMLRIATVKGEPTAPGDQPNVAEKYRVLSAQDKGGKSFDVEAWHLTGAEYDVWRFAGLDEDATAIAASTWKTLGIPVHGGSFAQAGR